MVIAGTRAADLPDREDFKDMGFHLKVGGMSGKFELLKMAKDSKKKLGGGFKIFLEFSPRSLWFQDPI